MKALLALALILSGTCVTAADTQDPDVNRVFDRNKGAIYAIYTRALRDNPRLAGKVIFDFDIATSGDVTACRVQSSKLDAPDVERKICARIALMKFSPRDATFTATKTVEFVSAL
ncbi:MAG TPA: AgmX/PglI C-terminal domain-containing protein [Steroidobacteraceae bacterium]|nr:AgmX/PglI C-terminal domain-containing protein [Steroidobacteraceae bacterium]